MGVETGVGFLIGLLIIWAGYLVRTKKTLFLLSGFRDAWEPVNEERLGNRIGFLLMIIVLIAIGTAIFGIWFGALAGKVSSFLVLGVIVFIIITIGLDRLGH